MRGRDYLWLVVLGILIVLHAAGAGARRDAGYDKYERLVQVLEEVKRHYVNEVDEEKLFLGAYKGMIAELDPYSQYMTRDDVNQLRVDTEGEFGGLGIEITLDENRILKVITPLEGTPAMESGVLPGDRIVEIDGKSTYRMSIFDAVKVLRGKPGTKVTITVVHEGRPKREKITITRGIIKVKSIRASNMADEKAKIGYIRMTNFQKTTVDELDQAVAKLRGAGMKALVLDLRRNPGGLLGSAVDVANRFIEKGTIVSTKGRAPNTVRRYSAQSEKTYENIPLAILVSGYSASASEIVAGAVQDHKRGILVGTRTFGKASVQSIRELGGGSALRLTTAKYYTPSGRCIHREVDAKPEDPWGIQPDIEVPTNYEKEIALLKHWRQQRIEEETNKKGKPKPEPAPLPKGAKDNDKDGKEEFVDEALVRAIDALKGILVDRQR